MSYVWAIVVIGVVGMPVLTLVALARGAGAIGLPARTTATVVTVGGVCWAGWLAGSVALAEAGAYQVVGVLPIVVAGVLTAVLLAARIPVIARILADPGTPTRLAVPQTVRVAGVVFLIAELPAVFALPAGLGDITIGIAALFVAWRMARPRLFNVLGIVDLVVAVGIGFLAAPEPVHLMSVAPSTAALTTLPLVLIPTTAVPLAVALHVISLRGQQRDRVRAVEAAAGPRSRSASR